MSNIEHSLHKSLEETPSQYSVLAILFPVFFISSYFIIGNYYGSWLWGFAILGFYWLIIRLAEMNPSKQSSPFLVFLSGILVIFPIPYAIFILAGGYKGIALACLFLLTTGFVKILIDGLNLLNSLEEQRGWTSMRLKFPDLCPEIVSDTILPLRKQKRKVDIRVCLLKFPIEYEVAGKHYPIAEYYYHWEAPEEQPMKEFDYNKDLRGTYFHIKYAPNDPSQIAVIYFEDKEYAELIQANKQQRNTRLLILFILAILGVFVILY